MTVASQPMIVLFTDFGIRGPYMGQMRAVLRHNAPGSPIIDLFADAPAYNARAASYLLAAYAPEFPAGTIFLCVVDPGVGGDRQPMVLQADGRVFVGPGNGLLELVARQAVEIGAQAIAWRPDHLSASFHGRDLFAPVAAAYARGDELATAPIPDADWRHPDWPDDLAEVIYLDDFGNAITGLRAAGLTPGQAVRINGQELTQARTFGAVPVGQAFWYENANGLVEIAVNQGSAAQQLGLTLGGTVELL
ncbi:MAG: SAM-dependent chlorinase/fluorinase [Proteobacteria bacterium]|nr:SAM-dependent chlorinase/fluorinase [Pseudomonadota bacterium]